MKQAQASESFNNKQIWGAHKINKIEVMRQ